jgi:hypothetical protein
MVYSSSNLYLQDQQQQNFHTATQSHISGASAFAERSEWQPWLFSSIALLEVQQCKILQYHTLVMLPSRPSLSSHLHETRKFSALDRPLFDKTLPFRRNDSTLLIFETEQPRFPFLRINKIFWELAT